MTFQKEIYYGLLGLCLITFLFNIKRLSKLYYWFFPLIIFAIAVQVIEEILKINKIKGYNFVFHIYQPLEYCLLASFYYCLIENSLVKKIIITSILAMFIFCIAYYASNKELLYGADFTDFCFEAIFVTVWVIIFFTREFSIRQ